MSELTEDSIQILKHINSIDQQGQGQNGSDSGPITVSNIKDYVVSNNLIEIKYTVGRHDTENHEDIIKNIRINHID